MSSVEAFHLFRIAREEAAERLLMPTAAVRRLSHGFGFCPLAAIQFGAEDGQSRVETAHSITSSARASSEGGTVRPSAFAVLRLMTNESFTSC